MNEGVLVDSYSNDAIGQSPAVIRPEHSGSVDSPASKGLPSLPTLSHKSVQSTSLQSPHQSENPSTTPEITPSSSISSSLERLDSLRQSPVSSKNSAVALENASLSACHLTIPTPPASKYGHHSHAKRHAVAVSQDRVENVFSTFSNGDETPLDPWTHSPADSKLPAPVTHIDTSKPFIPKDRVHARGPHTFPLAENPSATRFRRPSTSPPPDAFSADLKVEFIGSGASASVYKVTRHDKTVRAVKLIDLSSQSANSLHIFAQEVRTLKELWERQKFSCLYENDEDGPFCGFRYIMKLSSQDDFIGICGKSYLYVIMENYPSYLYDFRGILAQDELALRFIISQVTQGLNFLHAIGIIHMDLKPENIFVNEEGNCAIGDFGGSFYEPSVPSQLDRPTPRTSCCTAGFVAPEVVDHFNPTVNHLADFWSLGVSVYALVVCPPEFEWERTYIQLGLDSFMMAHKMNLCACPRNIWFMVMGMCDIDRTQRLDGHMIMDYLGKNYPPLPAFSPLLRYNVINPHDDPHTDKTTTESYIHRVFGNDLPSTGKITASYIR